MKRARPIPCGLPKWHLRNSEIYLPAMKHISRRRFVLVSSIAISVIACGVTGQRGRYKILGPSNEPTYSDGDWLITDKVDLSDIKRGDFVVLDNPVGEGIIHAKRVIALPGEKIEIVSSKVMVDGKELEENYLAAGTVTGQFGSTSWTVGTNELFVMGDNRAASQDSRFWGPLDYKLVRGRVIKE